MTWFRIDDGLADHPKVLALQSGKHWKGAIALWTLAGSWCSRHLTDGYVPAAVIARLGALTAEADALVAAGLWGRSEDGYAFHDWAAHNPLRAEIEAKREATRERVTSHRKKRGGNDDGNSGGNAVTGAVVTPLPSRPVPTQPIPERDLDAGGSLDGVAPAPGPTPVGIVEAAYETALGGVPGARYVRDPATNLPHWRAALDGVRALSSPGEVLRDAAKRLATEYVQERRSRSPQWFAEWLAKRAASGTRQTQGGYSAPSTNHRGTTAAEIEGYDG